MPCFMQAAAAAAFKPTPASGWWGAKMFASAGLLEGMDQDQKQRERGFDEDLQTKVYMDAHIAQRQGKKGLGKSTTLKIAGGWFIKAKGTYALPVQPASPHQRLCLWVHRELRLEQLLTRKGLWARVQDAHMYVRCKAAISFGACAAALNCAKACGGGEVFLFSWRPHLM
jgi:hypothetical protein